MSLRKMGSLVVAVVLSAVSLSGVPQALAEDSTAVESLSPPPLVSAPLEPESDAETALPPQPTAELAASVEHVVAEPPPAPPAAEGFVAGVSEEVLARREATSKVFENRDGTSTMVSSPRPMHFRAGDQWRDIDSRLVGVPGKPGTLRNSANSWTTTIGRSGFALEASGDQLTLEPVGGTPSAPQRDIDHEEQATFVDRWPEADLRYTVSSSSVKEDIILKSAAASARYEFAADRAYWPDPAHPGGLRFGGALGDAWRVDPPLVLAGGREAPEANARFEYDADSGRLAISVDPTWLANVDAADFPVIIDPSVSNHDVGSDWSLSVNEAGPRCEPCPLRTGNGFGDWQGFVHFPYTQLFGSDVLGAFIDIGDNRGWEDYTEINLYTADSDVGVGIAYDNLTSYIQSYGTSGTFGNTSLTRFQGTMIANHLQDYADQWDPTLWFAIDDYYGPYKEFHSFELHATYNQAPYAPSFAGPASPSHNLQPTLSVNTSDPQGEPITYTNFNVHNAVTGQLVWSQQGNSTSVTVPPSVLQWNTPYTWYAQSRDSWGLWGPWGGGWSYTPNNEGPYAPTAQSPVASVLNSSNIQFTALSGGERNGDPVNEFQFEITSSGRVATSPWTGASWTPPSGTISDGGKYSWRVRARDAHLEPGDWSGSVNFEVDLLLGKRSHLTFDELGPAAVNLATGNLVYTHSGPTFPTVGGPLGIGLTYNSQAPNLRGLKGDYYQDVNHNGVRDTSSEPVLLHRVDPQLRFNWGTNAPNDGPAPGVIAPEWWGATWTGSITVDTGGVYQFVSPHSDDTVKITIDNDPLPALNVTSCCTQVVGRDLDLTAGVHDIKVEYWQGPGGENLHLAVRGPNNAAERDIPTSWLTPGSPSLPGGWSRAGDTFGGSDYVALRAATATTTVVVDSSGADHTFTSVLGQQAWTAPPGEEAVLTRLATGAWTLLAEDGFLYGFDVDGRLRTVTSPTDPTRRSAPSYEYRTLASGPSRLDYIKDATDRRITFTYGGEDCPSDIRFSPAPPGMLCKVAYTGFGGTATDLYYNANNQLARIVEPGDEITDFAYDASGFLSTIRDPLNNDLIKSQVLPNPQTDPNAALHLTSISYVGTRVSAVRAPVKDELATDAQRAQRTYIWRTCVLGARCATEVDVKVAGMAEPNGYSRRVGADSFGHVVSDRDAAAIEVESYWDTPKNRLVKRVDHHYQDPAGLVTTFAYDHLARLTDTYGPGPASEFTSNPPTAPKSTTTYDGTIDGLAASWFPNTTLSGTPSLLSTSTGQENFAADTPGAPIVGGSGFSGRLTGEVTTAAGPYEFGLDAGEHSRLWVDNELLIDRWDTYREAVLRDTPLAYWRLGELSGATAVDATPNARHGSYSGTHSKGAAGGLAHDADTAVQYTAGGTYGSWSRPANNFAFEAWVQPTTTHEIDGEGYTTWGTSGQRYAFAADHQGDTAAGAGLSIGTNGISVYEHGSGYMPALLVWQGSVPSNAWTHVVVNYVNRTPSLYVNGVWKDTGTQSSRPNVYAPLAIGTGAYGDFPGRIDEAAFYGSALPDAAISAHYKAGNPSFTSTTKQFTAGPHAVRIDYRDLAGAAGLHLQWKPPNQGSFTSVPAASLKPRYGLVTASSDADSRTTSTQFARPERGLPTRSTVTASLPGENPVVELNTDVTYEPDAAGFLRTKQVTLPAGNATVSHYYGEGANPTAMDNPCTPAVENPLIDQGGALLKRVGPDPNRTEEFVYDAAGRVLATRINTEPWTCTTYDPRGRITSRKIPPSPEEQSGRLITYDYGSNIPPYRPPTTLTVADPAGTIETRTDWLGRTVRYQDVWGKVTTTKYNQAGQVTEIQTPTGGPSGSLQQFAYDAVGRPSGIDLDGTRAGTNGYDSVSGIATGVTYATNATSGTFGYDARGRDAAVGWVGSGWSYNQSVSRTSAGKIEGESINGVDANGTSTPNYRYDGAGRLIFAALPGHTYTYSFAPAGGCGTLVGAALNSNRTQLTHNSDPAVTYCYGAGDRLTQTTTLPSSQIVYDNGASNGHGNTTTLGTQTFSYDLADRHLTTTEGATTVRYQRDATDRIVARLVTVPGTITPRNSPSSTHNGNGSSTLTLSVPTTKQVGDVLVAQVTVTGGTGTTISAPQGWTPIDPPGNANANGTSVRNALFTHVVAAGDPTSVPFGLGSSQKASGGIAAYDGVDTAQPVNAWTLSTSTTATMTAPSITTTVPNTRLIIANGSRSDAAVATAPAGMTALWSVAPTSGGSAASRTRSSAYDEARPTAGATGPRQTQLAAAANAVTHVIALRPEATTTTTRYGFTNDSDSPSLTLDTGNVVTERTIALAGGALLVKTTTSGDVWSYPNLHGDVVVTAGSSGTKRSGDFLYSPDGVPLAGSPDTNTSSLDYGWLGEHQRPTEGQFSPVAVEMGQRLYSPQVGRFLEVDPVEGGSANDYDYANAEPINTFDLDGFCAETPTQRVRSIYCTPSTPREFAQARRNERAQAGRREHRRAAEIAQDRARARVPRVSVCGKGERFVYGAIGFVMTPPKLGNGGFIPMPSGVPGTDPSLTGVLCGLNHPAPGYGPLA